MSMSASSLRAKCWWKGGNSASCLEVLLDYEVAGMHWLRMQKYEPSILNGGFPFPLACTEDAEANGTLGEISSSWEQRLPCELTISVNAISDR